MSQSDELKAIQARWVLGYVSVEALPSIATDLLCQGIESKSLVELAGMPSREAGLVELFERAFEELGCGSMEPTEALMRHAKLIAAAILSSEISPIDGARRIMRATHDVGAHGFHSLDPFIYAASEAEDRPQTDSSSRKRSSSKPSVYRVWSYEDSIKSANLANQPTGFRQRIELVVDHIGAPGDTIPAPRASAVRGRTSLGVLQLCGPMFKGETS